MTLANAILFFFALVALAFVIAFAGVIFVWRIGGDRHDPHANAFGEAPFIPLGSMPIEGVYGDMPFLSAGVARLEAGDPIPVPKVPHGSPAVYSAEDRCRIARMATEIEQFQAAQVTAHG